MALPANFQIMTPETWIGDVTNDERTPKMFHDIKTALVAAGWLVTSSGDGLAAFSASGDVLTVRGIGANGVNDLAWFRIINPDGRELCLQAVIGFTPPFSAVATGVRSKYSFSAGFTGGTPSATQVPSATDEGIFSGTGTDAAPLAVSGGYFLSSNAGNTFAALRGMQLGILETVSPYRFLIAYFLDTALRPCLGGLMMDFCEPGRASWDDADPAVLYQAGRVAISGAAFGAALTTHDMMEDGFSTLNGAWAHMGGASAPSSSNFLRVNCFAHGKAGAPGGAVNAELNSDFGGNSAYAGFFFRPNAEPEPENGGKGFSTIFGFHATTTEDNRIFSRVEDGPGDAEYLKLNSCVMPWDGSDPYDAGWVNGPNGPDILNVWETSESFGGKVTRVIGAPAGLPEDIPGGFSIG